MIKRIGITGGIASGKSTCVKYLLEKNEIVLDSDSISHKAYGDADCYDKIKKYFPECIINQKVSRKILGDIIFKDKERKKQLEKIIHPYVLKQLVIGINQCQNKCVFLDIPLLFEAHMEFLCDEIWVVYVNHQTQLERLIARNNLTYEQAKQRIDSQIPLIEKCKKANQIIDNNTTYENLIEQVEVLRKKCYE